MMNLVLDKNFAIGVICLLTLNNASITGRSEEYKSKVSV